MDGRTVVRTLFRCALTALFIWLVGCSSFDPEPAHVPYSLFDSPLIAGGMPESSVRGHTGKPAATDDASQGSPSASTPSDSSAPADRADAASESETDRPALSSQRTTDTAPTESGAASEGDDQLSRDEASARTPSATSESAPATDRGAVHRDAARYVSAIYELNGVELPEEARTGIPQMYRHCRDAGATSQSGKPAAGDLAFFHNIRDADGDGRNNDWYTYVALVEQIDGSGTVTLLGYRDGKVRKFRMNTSSPDRATGSGGGVVNTKLRREQPNDPPYTQYLAGQLFAGYCALLGDKSELLVVDNWQPGMDLEPPD